MRFYTTPFIVQRLFPSRVWSSDGSDAIHLTFDDGPSPEVTPWVLRQLEGAKASATFFCVGKNLEKYAELASEVIAAGHQLANHTENHLDGRNTTTSEYLLDIQKCDERLHHFGIAQPMFRPPYGKLSWGQQHAMAHRPILMWSHMAWDFDARSDKDKSCRTLKSAKPGSILLFHDSKKAERQLKQILPELLSHYHETGMKCRSLRP
ncbi:MAG: polysaccharide deacetylase family protein [Bacteroidota bacterium]